MGSRSVALLVHSEEMPVAELEPLLRRQGFATQRARNCAEARRTLGCADPPTLVFTDTVLADGTWAVVEGLAEQSRPAVPVIAIHRFVDLRVYLDVMEGGAADLVVPPFRDADIAHVIRGALFRFTGRVLKSSATGWPLPVSKSARFGLPC
jgi:DNA-binding NtrC family response regulator